MAVSGVIRLDFEPWLELGGLTVRLQAVGVAAAMLVAIVLTARELRRRSLPGLRPLRADDLLYVALGCIPGAVIVGRLLHGLAFADVYQADPAALLDPARGSLSLLGAVLGGALSGAYIARLLDGSAGRWADMAAAPMLVGLGLGKLAQLLGGGGQGLPSDAPWAVAFSGAGPWLSPSPDVPAYPSQVLEALWAMAGLPIAWLLWRARVVARLPGRLRQTGRWAEVREERLEEVARGDLRFGYRFLAALGWWLLGRVLVGTTWRDDRLVGPFGAEQSMALAALAALVLGIIVHAIIGPGRASREERMHLRHRRWRVRQ
ncbi:MAG TPA: prolipoprotein diacylglyceryl transferase family protein [Candidatus Limnocylindrales bacterium]|nr:prolipoprotein diacylglyceryl transferase family protein [Candidatus Limnocylindrales bacterium]